MLTLHHNTCYIIIEQKAATPKFLNIEFLFRTCQLSHAIRGTHAFANNFIQFKDTYASHTFFKCPHISQIPQFFFRSHTSETIKFYEKKNRILGACVHLSSHSLIADMFRIMGPVIQKIE